MVLGLQELELVFDPVAGLGHGELEARLARLVGGLQGGQRATGEARDTTTATGVLVTQAQRLTRSR